jgi:hypothetical protein
MKGRQLLPILGWLALGALGLFGCAGAGPGGSGPNRVIGRITPAHFRFQTVNALGTEGEPGWRAVCIHAVMTNGNTGDTALCKFEVGIPMRSERADAASLAEDQSVCAYWANHAAHAVLAQAPPGEMTAVLCNQFKQTYRSLLRDVILGAEVSECHTSGLAPVVFNPFSIDFLSP